MTVGELRMDAPKQLLYVSCVVFVVLCWVSVLCCVLCGVWCVLAKKGGKRVRTCDRVVLALMNQVLLGGRSKCVGKCQSASK